MGEYAVRGRSNDGDVGPLPQAVEVAVLFVTDRGRREPSACRGTRSRQQRAPTRRRPLKAVRHCGTRCALPVGAVYLFLFAGLGLLQPLFPLYLTSRGLSAQAATFVLALGPLASVVVPPAFGLVADAYNARAAMLRVTTLVCSLVLLVFLQVSPTGIVLVALSLVFSIVRAPIPTLVDSAAYALAESTNVQYGRLRLCGSIGFVIAVVAGGLLVDSWGWEPLLAATAGAYALAGVAASCMRGHIQPRVETRASWLRLLYERPLWMLLAAVATSQVASGAYDACYALHLEALGYDERFIGLAWAFAVLAEIAVLAISARLVSAFGAHRLFVFAFATSICRWLLVALVSSPAALIALQLLHGITYPLFWVPAVMVVHRLAPRELATAAQGLLAAATGIGSAVGMMSGGVVFASVGGPYVFACASAVSGVAVVVALSLLRTSAVR